MARTKFGARLVRGLIYGLGLGTLGSVAGFLAGAVLQVLTNSNTSYSTIMALALFGIGLVLPIGIEISKDMEAEENGK